MVPVSYTGALEGIDLTVLHTPLTESLVSAKFESVSVKYILQRGVDKATRYYKKKKGGRSI